MKHIKAALLLALLSPLFCFAQLVKNERLLSFENPHVPDFITTENAQVQLSPNHFKDGLQSLRWDFQANASLSIRTPIPFEPKDPTGKDTYLSTFIVWVYNEKPIEGTVRFDFLKDGKVCSFFPFGLNYKGWRAAWVCYERDMQGRPCEGMNEIRLTAPGEAGAIYIDHLLTAAKTDSRHQTPDMQVPFVNAETESHWLALLKYTQVKPDLQSGRLTEIQVQDMKLIEERFKEMIYTPGELSEKELKAIKEEYHRYSTRRPLFYSRAAEAYERIVPDWDNRLFSKAGMDVGDCFNLMYRIACAYHNAGQGVAGIELKEMFLNMYEYIRDQGIAYGSGLGNITHYGYGFRNLYPAFFLMKDALSESDRLMEAQRTLQWYAITNEVFEKPKMQGMDMDAFNTMTTGRMASILIMEDSPEKALYLKYFSGWISNGCLPAPGLADSFKPDGAAFHHCNNYPAYAVGGLNGAVDMIYLLSKTGFAVSEQAHQTVKNVLLTMRFYCSQQYYPLAMSGRHPDGRGQLSPIQFARLALAGTPDGLEPIDTELAQAFLRLVTSEENPLPKYVPASKKSKEQKMMALFEEKGYEAEPDPNGNIALGYGCVSVQRRGNWLAVARGHSRYLWAAEHYIGANLYGRYLAHGSLQVLKSKDLSSGWQQDGFDWGRIPGTTAIHLPVAQLKANVLNVDPYSGYEEMLFSDEAFAGGLSQSNLNGNFAMKLHEHDKYNGSHRARKSIHFLEDKIVCLGSDIENTNRDYPTETTVFQLAVSTDEATDYWKKYRPGTNYWIDHLNIGYYIPEKRENKPLFEQKFPQFSNRQDTGEPTQGNWVSLTLSHGKAPHAASYEYVVFPETNRQQMERFAKKPTYRVLQKDKNAHIVYDTEHNIYSYAVFEKLEKAVDPFILETDTACLLMLDVKKMILTVCNPDLALYRGAADEIYDADGKRIERSIYSRPWKFNPSREIPVTITLKGSWDVGETGQCRIISRNRKQTILQFSCKDAASIDVTLKK